MNYCYLETPLGRLLIAGDSDAVQRINIPRKGQASAVDQAWRENSRGPIGEAVRQLREYFSGQRTAFDLPLAPCGTVFQRKVWRELQEIPYGKTISYGELARRVGNPNASRAVGAANGKNPIPIVIPCHRVIGAGGQLTGFSAGLSAKQILLDLESRA